MKLKNKRLILMSLLSTFGVGLLTLSIGGLNPHNATGTDTTAVLGNEPEVSDDFNDVTVSPAPNSAAPNSAAPDNTAPDSVTPTGSASTVTSTPTPVPTALPVASPTPVSHKVNSFETKDYPELNTLFQDYYLAKLSCDTEKMKELLSDPAYCPTEDELAEETAYVDDYGNLRCYVKKSYEADSYIVYVYHEVTFLNIKTPAPFIDKFYVVTDIDGQLKIYSPEYTPEFETYYNDRDQDQDVKELIEKTNKKSKKAIEKDEDLKIYLKKLSEWIAKNQ